MVDRETQWINFERSLTNQAPKSDVIVELFESLRVNAKAFGQDIIDFVPQGREQSLALTKLEESVMWAIKGIALHQDSILEPPEDNDF